MRLVDRKVEMLLACSLLVLGTRLASADAPKLSGFVDTTYNYDFNKPQSRVTAMRSFDRRTDSFLLNAAQLNIEGTSGDVGYFSSLDFGTDASVFKAAGTGNDAGLPTPPSNNAVNFEVQEAYLTYKHPLTGLQLKAGKFVTYEGIEVITSKDDFTVTRGHIFGLFEPYTHVGAVAGYAFPKVVDVWVGVVNGWDVQTDNNTGKTVIAKLGLNFGDKLNGSVSMTQGAEKNNNTNDCRTSVDTTWFVKPVSKLTVGLQANTGVEDHTSIVTGAAGHWYGLGIQPKYDFSDRYFVGSRYEWISDLDGARTGTVQVQQSFTIAPGLNVTKELMFRVEFRTNWASANVYEGSDGVFSKSVESSVSTELIYKF